jgi:hypothetical protein
MDCQDWLGANITETLPQRESVSSAGSDAAGWSFQIAQGDLSSGKWSPQIQIAPAGFIEPSGNATHAYIEEEPVPGIWARRCEKRRFCAIVY